MADTSPSLPRNPSLEQQKKRAKELLKAIRAGDPAALERFRRHLPDRQRPKLADAQFVIAREYDFESWARLKASFERPSKSSIDASLHQELAWAFEACDAARVRELLEQNPAARAAIDAPLFPFGATALGHAAGMNDPAMVDVLLDFGADPNRRSDWWAGGWHVLHSATGAVADRLIQAGAVPDACAAAHLDRIDLLRDLLARDPARVHERGGDGQTPLHFARSRGVVDLLLERGADADARDLDHRGTPAEWMLDRRQGAGRWELARHLVERGASADVFLAAALGLVDRLRELIAADPSLLELRTGQGEYAERPPSSFHIYTWTIGQNLSPLQVARQFGQDEALEVLRAAASPRLRLLDACARADADAARRILAEHPSLGDELPAADQRALPDAAWASDAPAVGLMLELGFDATTPGQDGGTVLHCAAWQGSAACVEVALRHPAVRESIGRPDPTHGSTPLGWCCHGARHSGQPIGGHVVVARMLLDAGAQPGADTEGAPPEVDAVLRSRPAE